MFLANSQELLLIKPIYTAIITIIIIIKAVMMGKTVRRVSKETNK